MNNSKHQATASRRWLFTAVLVVALVAAALISTAATNALSGGQALDQLRSYYVYLPVVFHQ